MRKFLTNMALLVMVALTFSCELTDEEKIELSLTYNKEYKEAPGQLTKAPTSVTFKGKEYKIDTNISDEFEYANITDLEATKITIGSEQKDKWETHKVGYLRRGTNFWDNYALTMAGPENQKYLSVLTRETEFKNLGIQLNNDIKKTCQISDENGKVMVSGAIITKAPTHYGIYVARLKMNKTTKGHWNAFWTYNDKYEFDIFEYHDRSASFPKEMFDQTTHYNYNNQGARHSYRHYDGVDDVSEWNTYALVWTPEMYAYYINWEPTYYVAKKDGKYYGDASPIKESILNGTDNKLIPDTETNVFFSTEIANGVVWAENWAGHMDMDKIRQDKDSMDVDYFAYYPLKQN